MATGSDLSEGVGARPSLPLAFDIDQEIDHGPEEIFSPHRHRARKRRLAPTAGHRSPAAPVGASRVVQRVERWRQQVLRSPSISHHPRDSADTR